MNVALTGGWLPFSLQAVTLVIAMIARCGRRWRAAEVAAAVMAAVVLAGAAVLFTGYQGWTSESVSMGTVTWIAMTGGTLAGVAMLWAGARWWRRLMSIVAVPLCVVCAALALNTATSYFPTLQSFWQRVTGTMPPDWIDQPTLNAMVKKNVRPTRGTVVSIHVPDDRSGFAHRTEFVYLPPAWFAVNPPPRLPVVMMLGAEFSSPPDWSLSADGVRTLDAFAARHRGATPVAVFPDTAGNFSNDTECVNGLRGNAADHLVKEVVPYVISHFGVSDDPSNWGLAGWSSGGDLRADYCGYASRTIQRVRRSRRSTRSQRRKPDPDHREVVRWGQGSLGVVRSKDGHREPGKFPGYGCMDRGVR